MLTSMRLALYCLLCQSLAVSSGFRQRNHVLTSKERRFNSLLPQYENRETFSSNSGDVLQKGKQKYDLNTFLFQDFTRNMDSELTNTLPDEDMYLRLLNRESDRSGFNVNEISTDFPKTKYLVSQVLRLPQNSRVKPKRSGYDRSKKYRASVADRIAHGFGKRSGSLTVGSPTLDDKHDLVIPKIKEILKQELLKRVIYYDDYDAFVAYLDAFNDQIKDSGNFRQTSEDGYDGKDSLQIPLRSASGTDTDADYFGHADFGTAYDTE